MKKVLSLVALIAVAIMLSSTVWAAPIQLTKEAYAFFEGTVAFSADLCLWQAGAGYDVKTSTDAIWWDPSGIELKKAQEQWKTAESYCLISSTITTEGAKVYVYTDNQNNSDIYIATAPSLGNYRGLVKANSKGGEGNFAPVNCLYCSTTTATSNYKDNKPTIVASQIDARILFDCGDTGFDAAFKDTNCIVADDNGNYASSGGDIVDGRVNEDVVMFFGAGFTNVKGGQKYGTTKITFVANME